MESFPRHPVFKQKKNEEALTIYALCLLILIVIVISTRRIEAFYKRSKATQPSEFHTHVRNAWLGVHRLLSQRTYWVWCGRPTLALVILVTVYLTGNALLGSTHFASREINHWASRIGWLCVANIALCTVLGLKNTPWVSLASAHPALLNTLHRIVGYIAVFLLALHATLYTIHNYRRETPGRLLKTENLEGMGAGIGMVTLFLAIYRHRGYEVFLASHRVAFMVVVMLASLHRPNWAKKMPQTMIFTGGIWLVDRIVIASRLLLGLVNNSVAITALPAGGTRMVLSKGCSGGTKTPGLYYYVWIPRLSLFQTHPFTAVANDQDGLEFVAKAQGGFTGVLHDVAVKSPSKLLWASLDGPYGHLPDVKSYNKKILVAGGSGAAFTFGLMNHIMEGYDNFNASIDFIWAVRNMDQVQWYLKHLHTLLHALPRVQITIFVTRAKQIEISGGSEAGTGPTDTVDAETSESTDMLPNGLAPTYGTLPRTDFFQYVLTGVNIRFQKMDPALSISEAVDGVPGDGRILVAACGPTSLMNEIKDTTERIERNSCHVIDIHCEDFEG